MQRTTNYTSDSVQRLQHADAAMYSLTRKHGGFTMAKKFAYPVIEQIVWVQTQAPAGNWVDSTGFIYGNGTTMESAIKDAEQIRKYDMSRGTMARIVRKTIEVLVEA